VGVDGNLLVGWERSAGLRAPRAPEEGALVPNGTGYLLAVGPAAQRLQPRAWAAARWTAAMAVPVVLAMPFLLVPAPYGLAGVAALGALACWLPGAALRGLARVRLMRRLARAQRWSPARRDGVPPTSAGRLVRVRGIVAAQATVPSLFTNRAVVMATSECAGAAETRGIDFTVELDGGQYLRVPARDAILLGRAERVRGQPTCGPVALSLVAGKWRLRSALLSADGWLARLVGLAARELTLSPGDEVEIAGVVDLEPDPDAHRGFERAPAMRAVMRPVEGWPVIVCRRDEVQEINDATNDAINDAVNDVNDDATGEDDAGGASPVGPATVTSAPE